MDAVAGTNVKATIRDAPRVYATVSAMSTKICLVIPLANTMGANTHTVVSVEEAMAPPTPLAPSAAAFLIVTPSFLSR